LPAEAIKNAPWIRQALLVAIAFGGGFLFHRLSIPAGWVSGSMIAPLVMSRWISLPELRSELRQLGLLVAGITMGASVTPQTVQAFAAMPLSFLILLLCMGLTMGLTSLMLKHVLGWRMVDALLASAPGALSTVLAVAADRKADVARIAIVQNMRLLLLVSAIPALSLLHGRPTDPLASTAGMLDAVDLSICLLASVPIAFLAWHVGLSVPLLLGATIASAVLHGAGWIEGHMPDSIAVIGFVLIGAFVVGRVQGLNWSSVRRDLVAGFATFLIGLGVAAVLALLPAFWLRIDYASVLLAYAPGALEVMTLLSVALKLDPIYVGAHHILRFVLLGLSLPLLVGWLSRSR
jgi:uncharacterized protein